MNKHLKKYIKSLYFQDNESSYYLALTFCNESFIDFNLLANDFDFFIDIISDLKNKTIIKKLKSYNNLNKQTLLINLTKKTMKRDYIYQLRENPMIKERGFRFYLTVNDSTKEQFKEMVKQLRTLKKIKLKFERAFIGKKRYLFVNIDNEIYQNFWKATDLEMQPTLEEYYSIFIN